MKKHFSDEDCLDFVRRLLPQAQSERMRQHLDDGCERCNKLCNVWTAVAGVACREVRFESSEPSVRVAKAAYLTRRTHDLVPQIAKMIPLVFDSLLSGNAAAVRGDQFQAPARRLLHRTRSWAVDLRLEATGTNSMALVGQVLRSSKKSSAVIADVILMHGETVVAQTATNEFGEFQLQSPTLKKLSLYLDIHGRLPLGIALPDPDT